MRLLPSLSVGLIDSALASLATFGVGVYAARFLDMATLGLFALHFAAFTLVATLSHQGLFIPIEAAASRARRGLRFVARSMSVLWVPALAAPLVLLLPRAVAPGAPIETMGLAAAVAVFFSPIQDHVRRMLHLGGISSGAASVSAVQATGVAVALWFLHGRAPAPAVPFAALAFANLLSLSWGLVLVGLGVRRLPPGPAEPPPPALAVLARSGRWLLGAQISSAAATFVAASLLSRLGSIEALGMADAARIVGRPVLVVTTGMTAVLGPRLMRAAAAGDEGEGERLGRFYRLAVTSCVVGYVAVFGWVHPLNPLSWLVPTAFAVPFLVVATCLANGVVGLVLPSRFEAIGAGREPSLLRLDLMAGVCQVAVACLSGLLQAFAVPAGNATFALVRRAGLRRIRAEVYGDPTGERPIQSGVGPARVRPAPVGGRS